MYGIPQKSLLIETLYSLEISYEEFFLTKAQELRIKTILSMDIKNELVFKYIFIFTILIVIVSDKNSLDKPFIVK